MIMIKEEIGSYIPLVIIIIHTALINNIESFN